MDKMVMIFGKVYKDDLDDFEELKELLGGIGISVRCRNEDELESVSFSWDDKAARKKMSRGAGAKEKGIVDEKGYCMRLSEVETLMAELGADKTAEKLGIGRATLFRRLKKARDYQKTYGDDAIL